MTGPSSRAGLFETFDGCLALPAERLQVVVEAPRVFPLPGVRRCIGGVLLYRDQAVPLIVWPCQDSRDHPVRAPYVVIVATDYGLVGIPVLRVLQVAEGLVGAPDASQYDGLPAVAGEFRDGAGVYPLVDIDQLVENLPDTP